MHVAWYWPEAPAVLEGRFVLTQPHFDRDVHRITDTKFGYHVCRIDFASENVPNPENPQAFLETLLMGAEIYYQEHYVNGKASV